jgi:hypothetical protein
LVLLANGDGDVPLLLKKKGGPTSIGDGEISDSNTPTPHHRQLSC